jgi:hypothetical protein
MGICSAQARLYRLAQHRRLASCVDTTGICISWAREVLVDGLLPAGHRRCCPPGIFHPYVSHSIAVPHTAPNPEVEYTPRTLDNGAVQYWLEIARRVR